MEDYKIYTTELGLQEFDKAVKRQGLYQQLEQSNILPYHNLKRIDIENYVNNMFGISESCASDPLWVDYKAELDPKLGVKYPTESYRMDILDMSTGEYKIIK